MFPSVTVTLQNPSQGKVKNSVRAHEGKGYREERHVPSASFTRQTCSLTAFAPFPFPAAISCPSRHPSRRPHLSACSVLVAGSGVRGLQQRADLPSNHFNRWSQEAAHIFFGCNRSASCDKSHPAARARGVTAEERRSRPRPGPRHEPALLGASPPPPGSRRWPRPCRGRGACLAQGGFALPDARARGSLATCRLWRQWSCLLSACAPTFSPSGARGLSPGSLELPRPRPCPARWGKRQCQGHPPCSARGWAQQCVNYSLDFCAAAKQLYTKNNGSVALSCREKAGTF